MGPIIGKVAYHAGASGPVTLDKNERVLHIRALGGAGGKLTIDGGDEIPIPANYVFDDSITDGRGEQWVGRCPRVHVHRQLLRENDQPRSALMARDRRPEEAPRSDLRGLSLLDYIPKVSPELTRPDHWAGIADILSHAIRGDLRVVFSAPVQHGKSILAGHAIPWWHQQDETLSIFYVTYAQQYTEIRSREIRRLTEESGCRFREDHKRLDGWSFEAGGRAVMTSIEGPGTGLPGNIFVVDDPFKGPTEAYSAQRRQQVIDWYRYVLTARRAPKASHFVIASRWDEDDLSGYLIREKGYTEFRLPAICDDPETDPNHRQLGEPLCPWGPNPSEPRDLAFLEQLRKELGEHAWNALCQGRRSPPIARCSTGSPPCVSCPPPTAWRSG
jgi:hypothetical protein